MVSPLSGLVRSPFTFPSDGVWTFEAVVDRTARGSDHLAIRAKDCVERIEVDGREIFSTRCVPWLHWFPVRFDLPASPAGAQQTVRLQVRDLGGLGLLDLRQANGMTLPLAALLLLLGGGWLLASRRLGLSAPLFWIGAAALLLGAAWFLATDPWERAPDIDGHRAYVAWLLRSKSLPPVTFGWSTWHPPLFHILAAIGARISGILGPADPARGMQAVSLAAWFAALALAFASPGVVRRSAGGLFAAALFAFLPVSLLVAVRINNDALLPLAGVAVVAGLVAWERTGKSLPLVAVAVALLAAVATKTSAVALAAGAAFHLLALGRERRAPLLESARRALLVTAPAFAFVGLFQLRTLVQTGRLLYTPAARIPAEQIVPNNLHRWLSFDLPALLSERAFLTAEGKVRLSMPTSVLASSVLGEYDFSYLGRGLLLALLAGVLVVPLYLAAGAIRIPAGDEGSVARLARRLVAPHLLFIVAFNAATPYASCHDARLWAPVFLPLALLAGAGLDRLAAAATSRAPLRLLVLALPFPLFAALALFHARIVLP